MPSGSRGWSVSSGGLIDPDRADHLLAAAAEMAPAPSGVQPCQRRHRRGIHSQALRPVAVSICAQHVSTMAPCVTAADLRHGAGPCQPPATSTHPPAGGGQKRAFRADIPRCFAALRECVMRTRRERRAYPQRSRGASCRLLRECAFGAYSSAYKCVSRNIGTGLPISSY